MSHRKKKYLRDLYGIGKRKYDFDFHVERDIYRYVSCYPMKKKELDNLNDDYRFDSYKSWKQYIVQKYEDFTEDELMEFDRYLNRRKRSAESSWQYLSMIIPIIFSIVLTEIFSEIFNMKLESSTLAICLVAVVITVFFVIILVLFSWYTTKTMEDSNVDKYMLNDYQEIINDMRRRKFPK